MEIIFQNLAFVLVMPFSLLFFFILNRIKNVNEINF